MRAQPAIDSEVMPSSSGAAYAAWVQQLLGVPTPTRKWADNPVTGAVGGTSQQFAFFVARFRERLTRLWAALPSDHEKLLEKIANVGTENWYGYFAELAAWDFFAHLPLGLAIEVAPPGAQLGATECILDGRLGHLWGLHFDVKALADVTKMVLDRVRARIEADHPDVSLGFSYALDLGQTVVPAAMHGLTSEIQRAIREGRSFVNHDPSRVQVRIHKPRPSVTITEHSFDPYHQARELRLAPLSDARQFVKGAPNLLVYVVHHWFNLTNANNFGGQQHTFFRALARRVFCELTKDSRQLSEVLVDDLTGVTVQDAARHLSGIVFLVDHTVLGRRKRDPSTLPGVMEAFVYANPNAATSSDGDLQLDQLVANASRLISVFEKFRFDNY